MSWALVATAFLLASCSYMNRKHSFPWSRRAVRLPRLLRSLLPSLAADPPELRSLDVEVVVECLAHRCS
jgi:hypothetical protein